MLRTCRGKKWLWERKTKECVLFESGNLEEIRRELFHMIGKVGWRLYWEMGENKS